MATAISLPAFTTTADRAAEIHAAWMADPEMPQVHGCAEDAVRVLAVRAVVAEASGGELAAALVAPTVVELTAHLLVSQFPELRGVFARTGHTAVPGGQGGRWEPGGYLHRAYAEAFGPVTGRHWPA